jgi:hypothetical protein
MIASLQAKARTHGVEARIEMRVADIETFVPGREPYDALFSNFGAINCLGSLRGLERLSAQVIRPRGYVMIVAMGRIYPLETAAFLMKGDLRNAFRRLRRSCTATVEGQTFPVRYFAPRELRRVLGSDFSMKRLAGLYALQAAPGLDHLARYVSVPPLRALDSLLTHTRLTASWADHYLSIWQKSG